MEFVVGELIMGYVNSEWIQNGQDYKVVDIEHTRKHEIPLGERMFSGLKGVLVGLKDLDYLTERHVFVPDAYEPCNLEVLEELVRRAEKVNEVGSTGKDYRAYMNLKSQLTFMTDIYRYDGKIMTQSEFNAAHPLMFTKVWDVITEKDKKRIITKTTLTQQIFAKYPKLIEVRAGDGKPIADSEEFADKYKIIDKDIDYGYAITAHKPQGSTYPVVFVDETDFAKISDRWNHKRGFKENRTKEKNQLLYVAYTRCSKNLIVYYKD